MGLGVYLPCVKPENMVDYIFVGMEPSFGWADSVEDGEKKVEEGFTNFGASTPPNDAKHPLDLLKLSIERFLCRVWRNLFPDGCIKGSYACGDGRHRTANKGMKNGIPCCWKRSDIVGKPCAPIIAIGKRVERLSPAK